MTLPNRSPQPLSDSPPHPSSREWEEQLLAELVDLITRSGLSALTRAPFDGEWKWLKSLFIERMHAVAHWARMESEATARRHANCPAPAAEQARDWHSVELRFKGLKAALHHKVLAVAALCLSRSAQ